VVSVNAVRSRLSESSASTEANMTLRLSACFFRTPLTRSRVDGGSERRELTRARVHSCGDAPWTGQGY
jgi:hypothetical protein